MRIESTTNRRIKAVRRLRRGRERARTGRALIEGPKLVETALDAGMVPREIYAVERTDLVERCEAAGSEVVEISEGVLEAISTTVEPQSPVAVIAIPAAGSLESRRTLVAVGVGDPGNLGTLVRTASAFGWQVATMGGVDPWSPKALRASAGAQLVNPVVTVRTVGDLVAANLYPVASVVGGGIDPDELAAPGHVALLVGNEAGGLDSEVVNQCRASVTIPIHPKSESLNAAVAGAIAMYVLGHPETNA